MNTIENKIVDSVKTCSLNILKENATSTSEWTKAIKLCLVNLGKEIDKNISVYTNNVDNQADWGEWLWDLVWAKQKNIEINSEYGVITSLELITEIEWLTEESEILIDFQKLVFGNAEIKLFIFNKFSKEYGDRVLHLCKNEFCVKSKSGEDRYLLIGIPSSNKEEFLVEHWIK